MPEVQSVLKNTIPHVYETSQITEYPSRIHSISEVKVSKDNSGRLIVAFPYNPLRVSKIKTIEGHKWLMISLLYGASLRLMECLCLRVKDVDFTADCERIPC